MGEALIISDTGISSLFASNGTIDGNGEMAVANTRMNVEGHAKINWIIMSKGGNARIAINYASEKPAKIKISNDYYNLAVDLPKSAGPFLKSEPFCDNFEQYILERHISLPTGQSVLTVEIWADIGLFMLSSVELAWATDIGELMETERRAKKVRLSLAKYADGFGFMVHWTANAQPETGDILSYAEAVDKFNVEMFAEQADRAGVKYIFFTANHALPHFPGPLPEWEQYFPGMTTKRDLISDLSYALRRRNIDLMLYLNFTAAFMCLGNGQGNNLEKNQTFTRRSLTQPMKDDYCSFSLSLLKSIGEKYKELVHGYWIDSCYQTYQHFINMDYEPFYYASKEGNPDRIVCFNFWILPTTTPWQDFWAGEVCNIIKSPATPEYEYGCAKGHKPHALLFLEDNWCHSKANTPISLPKYKADDLIDLIRRMNSAGGMVTLNPEVYQDGRIGSETMELLIKIKDTLKKGKQ